MAATTSAPSPEPVSPKSLKSPKGAESPGGFAGFIRQISGGSTAGDVGFGGWLRQISGASAMPAEREVEDMAPELSDISEEQKPTASAPADDGGPLTLFGELADICLQAQVRSSSGKVVDVQLKEFVLAAEKYQLCLGTMGSAVGMVLSDISKNLSCVKDLVDKEPEARRTQREFMQVELNSGRHTPLSDGVQCRLGTGACELQWLLRGLEMFLLMLKLIYQGDPNATSKAYAQTLQPYHSWMTSAGVRTLLMGMPGKDTISSRKALAPKLAHEPELLKEHISKDVDRATSVMLPMVRLMICTCREFGLWESSQA